MPESWDAGPNAYPHYDLPTSPLWPTVGPPLSSQRTARKHIPTSDARFGTGALENFPHLACTLRRSCVSASSAHAHTQLRPSVHARWGKFSSVPVPNLASLIPTTVRVRGSPTGSSHDRSKNCTCILHEIKVKLGR